MIVGDIGRLRIRHPDGSDTPCKFRRTGRKMVVSTFPDSGPEGHWMFDRPVSDTLIVDGDCFDRTIHVEMAKKNLDECLLLDRGFDWIQEYPIDRWR